MDGQRFDDLARSIARRPNRRAVLKGLLGAVAGGLLTGLGLTSARAQGIEAPAIEPPLPAGQIAEQTDAIPAPAPRRLARGNRTPTARPTAKSQTTGPTAQATPRLTLSPTSGKAGNSIRATISGFRSRERITLYWYDGSTRKTLLTGTASSSGRLAVSFSVPKTFRGGHKVLAQGTSSRADATLSVVRSLVLSVRTGPVGTLVTAKLYGFSKSTTVQVRWFSGATAGTSAKVVKSGKTSSSGLVNLDFRVPSGSALGTHRVDAIESNGGSASNSFVVGCPSGTSKCGATCCANGLACCGGQCADLDSDAHCGECGAACEDGQACVQRQCVCTASSCPNGCCDGDGHCQTNATATCGVGGAACDDCRSLDAPCVVGVCDRESGTCGSEDRIDRRDERSARAGEEPPRRHRRARPDAGGRKGWMLQ